MNPSPFSSLKNDKEVINLIKDIVGEKGMDIVMFLFDIDKADEFEIAEKLGKDVNFVRSVMYKMYTHNLVNYTRRRDQTKGWYIYTWEVDPKKIYKAILTNKKEKLDYLYKSIEVEKNKEQEFICDRCKIRFTFDKALNLNFKCFACGDMLNPLDNSETIDKLNQEIKKISEDIGLLREKINDLE